MTPASIVIPTRERLHYLEVALASIVPQAAAIGADVLVVDDAGPSPGARALAARCGARYEPHAAPLGLNAARNTGVELTTGELVVFVDDDIRAGPGWLGALIDAAREHPRIDVFTGPIRASLEGRVPRSCGGEAPPITTLDLGPADADVQYAWGANLAIRRSALERVGPFDISLEHGGDEQDWQERLREQTPDARVLYVARAAVEHRRAGADTRIRALSRTAYARGAAARRHDARRGLAPSSASELLTLAGCLGHVLRRRCPAGLTMVAHSAGRLREGLGERRRRHPAPRSAASGDERGADASDAFLSGESGTVGGLDAVRRRIVDGAFGAAELLSGQRLRLAIAARGTPARRRVLVLGVERPEHQGLARAARAELRRSRHHVEMHTRTPQGRGKFENLNELLAAHPPDDFDWLLVVDDDVELPHGFLDRFLFLSERFSLLLAQPAHRLDSHAAWAVTRRRAGSVAHETSFVEIGPVTAFARATFPVLLPFPALRMGWGLDVHWAALARERGWRCGVIDAVAIRHRAAPAAASYAREEAVAEARAFLAERPYLSAGEAQRVLHDPPPLVTRPDPARPKVAIVAEFYPSRRDPVLGVWSHLQALAAREAGADVRVLVLHRLVPPRASLAAGARAAAGTLGSLLREPRLQTRDGLQVAYVPYLSPPRDGHYSSWGAWAAPALALALRRLARSFPFELIHAHNAVPAADAARRALSALRRHPPLVVSVHGGDVLYTAPRGERGARAVERNLSAARLVLANSQGIAELARAHGAGDARVVHLGAEPAPAQRTTGRGARDAAPTLVTVGHLVARKRHADVLRALAVLGPRHPSLRYSVVGDGPERVALEGLAARLRVAERVDFHGQLPPREAVEQSRRATLFVMPSTEEAFGVAYIEAMAAGVPAIGCRGEPGPEEIAAAGDGFMLVPPGDIERLTQRIDELLSDPHRLREAGQRARATVAANFTWERCGEQTLAAYRHVLG